MDITQRKARGGLLVAALAALTLSVAGCGGDSAKGSSTSPPAVQGGGVKSSDSEQAVKYSQCMRSNGVPGFPDPVNGRLQLEAKPGGPVDPNSPQFKAAEQKCKDFQPPGMKAGSPQNKEQQAKMLKFVACMRQNGVPNFPDPKEGGAIMMDGKSGIDPNSPQFKSAMQKCQKLIPGGAPGGGQ